MTRFAMLVMAAVLAEGTAAAQTMGAGPVVRRAGLHAVVSADTFVEDEGAETGATVDLLGAWRLGDGLELMARPLLRRGHDGEWEADLAQLALRMDRHGAVRLRLEGGYLPSPIGLAPLESRADANPLVAPVTSYTARLPLFEAGTPRTQLSSPLYPLAAQAIVSSTHWDARAAVLESSLARVRPLAGDDRAPRAPQVALGGGVTPVVGLRLGGSFSRGRYARASEVADPSRGDRHATIVGVDGDYSFGYTRVYGEWIRTAFDLADGTAVASGLTLTAVRTLAPRWFVAARAQRLTTSNLVETVEGSYGGYRPPYGDYGSNPSSGDGYGTYGAPAMYGAPATYGDHGEPQSPAWLDSGRASALSLESALAYRLSPDVTLRAGYLGYRAFGDGAIEHHATFAVVWSSRWW